MSRVTQRAKKKPAPKRTRKTAGPRVAVPKKASNWLHAKARDTRRGHNLRSTFLSLGLALAVFLVLGLWLSGNLGRSVRSVKSYASAQLIHAGFGVSHINVVGLELGSAQQVRRALAVEMGELVFAVDLEAARNRVESLGWVKEASVMRLLPNRITVKVKERRPFALWQKDGQVFVVNDRGDIINTAQRSRAIFRHLPYIVGAGAAKAAPAFVATLARYPEVQKRTRALIRVSNRRWTLKLRTGADLLLPEEGVEAVLGRFNTKAKLQRLLDSDLARIDARSPGVLWVRAASVADEALS